MDHLERFRKLVAVLDLSETRVVRPTPLIFLCGGVTDKHSAHPRSLREALLRSLPARDYFGSARIILAEAANEALPETHFRHLLDLEECLAAAVDSIPLFVESAGSICELGAFTQAPEARRKLSVFISNDHFARRSFIRLGPIQDLANDPKGSKVYPYDWTVGDDGIEIADFALQSIKADLNSVLDSASRAERLRSERLSHRIYLSLAIAFLLRGAKLREITEILEAFGVKDVNEGDVKKYINTLEICGLIKQVPFGRRVTYYIPLVGRINMEPAFLEGTDDRDRNLLRWTSLIASDVAENDEVRIKLFQEHNRGA